MSKTEELEGKIKKVAEVLGTLRKENLHLKTERDSLKSHVSMLTSENHKAQRAMADFEQLRKKHDAVAQRVERALASVNAMRHS